MNTDSDDGVGRSFDAGEGFAEGDVCDDEHSLLSAEYVRVSRLSMDFAGRTEKFGNHDNKDCVVDVCKAVARSCTASARSLVDWDLTIKE